MKALEISKIKEEDEDMENPSKPQRNFWSKRPLPFIIGTKEYVEDDFAGLQYESEGTLSLSVRPCPFQDSLSFLYLF
jgi:hypothetical protein